MQKQVIREKQTLAQVEEQVQVMKPLLQAEVRLLRMSQQEFEQDVRTQLDTNPALEEDADDFSEDNSTADPGGFSGCVLHQIRAVGAVRLNLICLFHIENLLKIYQLSTCLIVLDIV